MFAFLEIAAVAGHQFRVLCGDVVLFSNVVFEIKEGVAILAARMELPFPHPDGPGPVELLMLPLILRPAQKLRQVADTVDLPRRRYSRHFACGGEKVPEGAGVIACAPWFDAPGPAGDGGHP